VYVCARERVCRYARWVAPHMGIIIYEVSRYLGCNLYPATTRGVRQKTFRRTASAVIAHHTSRKNNLLQMQTRTILGIGIYYNIHYIHKYIICYALIWQAYIYVESDRVRRLRAGDRFSEKWNYYEGNNNNIKSI